MKESASRRRDCAKAGREAVARRGRTGGWTVLNRSGLMSCGRKADKLNRTMVIAQPEHTLLLWTPSAETVRQPILVVDDEASIREILAKHLESEGHRCDTAANGVEALKKLMARPYSLVITDILMPECDGRHLLREIEKNFPEVAVIMVTAVIEVETAVDLMREGACDYLTKPFGLEEVSRAVRRALDLRRKRVLERRISQNLRTLAPEAARDLEQELLHDFKNHQVTLELLMKALDARGHETQCHSRRVKAYTVRLAHEFGYQDERLIDLARGALLHDIGKIGVPDRVLNKPGPLTPEETRVMREHPAIGYRILQGVEFLDNAARMVLCHHENFDGTGYLQGLAGQDIPLEARIFAVMDAYDAMTSDRPYRRALPAQVARARIMEAAGTQFDPEVVKRFLEVPQEEWDAIHRSSLISPETQGALEATTDHGRSKDV